VYVLRQVIKYLPCKLKEALAQTTIKILKISWTQIFKDELRDYDLRKAQVPNPNTKI
jgi:hypothetical protein